MLNKKLGLFLLFLFIFIIGCSKKKRNTIVYKIKPQKKMFFRINQ